MSTWGFGTGAALGALAAAVAIMLTGALTGTTTQFDAEAVRAWLGLNLGTSAWLFALVLALYVAHMASLTRMLRQPLATGDEERIARLDQITDVWIQLFVGIGVIWTAIGMRSALQAALGDGAGALASSADSVLKKLVDGGILLALSTTIVGGIGSYLMRLAKTTLAGAGLHRFYNRAGTERDERLERLLAICASIETELKRRESKHAPRSDVRAA